MKIALIGAGNVATHLGKALAQTNHQILQVYSRTEESAALLAQQLNTLAAVKDVKTKKQTCNHITAATRATAGATNVTTTWTTRLDEVTSEADLYLVMLKDSVLQEVLPRLVTRNPNALFVHTAGSIPMNIWEGLTQRYGVLYPMQTFSKARAVDFAQVHFFVEAREASDVTLLKDLAGQLSSHVVEASSEQRKYLHLSAVFACNFSNHMYAICEKLLTAHGLPFSAMFPLIDETANKVHHLSPVEGQTGPAQRNDINVMEKQEKLLKEDTLLNDPAVAEIYRALSQHIVHYQQERQQQEQQEQE